MKKLNKFLLIFFILFFLGICLVSSFNFLIGTGLVKIVLDSNNPITISSPLNITYNFTLQENYTIGLNVSSSRTMSSWWYELVHEDSLATDYFSPNTTIIAFAGNNTLFIYGEDIYGNTFSKNVSFFVNITSDTAPHIFSPTSIYVCEGRYLPEFGIPPTYFNISYLGSNSLSTQINPSNIFYVIPYATITPTLKKYEIFSGKLTKSDAGGLAGFKTHIENISVNDGVYSDLVTVNITVIGINNPPVIANDLGVQTLSIRGDNTTLYHNYSVTDIESGRNGVSFSINFSNISLFTINNNGIINFTANASYLGVYNVSVCVIDNGLVNPYENISYCNENGSNKSDCNSFSITVTNENRAPKILRSTPTDNSITVNSLEKTLFSVSLKDPDGTIPDTYWYVDDELKMSGNGVLSEFDYTFSCESKDYIVKAVATDGLLNDSVNWSVYVNNHTCIPTPSGGGGGGGGGGSEMVVCQEKWGCSEWEECHSLKESIESSKLDVVTIGAIKERCLIFNWGDNLCGFQKRNCVDVDKCSTNLSFPGIFRECYFTINPTCSDKIKNCHGGSCEVLVDCGGPCLACPTCSDKIKNQGETDVDCGGPCFPCIPKDVSKLMPLYIFAGTSILIFLVIGILIIRSYLLRRELNKFSKR